MSSILPMNDWIQEHLKKSTKAHHDGFTNLGKIVYFYQHMEDDLRAAVSFLIDTAEHETGAIVTSELSMRQLVSVAYSLFALFIESKKDGRLNRWKQILTEAQKAEQRRNQILHSRYGVSVDFDPKFFREKVTAKFGKGLDVQGEDLDQINTDKVTSHFGSISTEITVFMAEVFPGWHLRQWKRKQSN